MVLSNGNYSNLGQNSYQCGTVPKCSACLYKLICPKSPFCCISGNSCDITPVISSVAQLNSLVSSGFDNTDNSISNVQTNLNSIGAMLNSMNESINSIGSVVNEILSKISVPTNNFVLSSNQENTKDTFASDQNLEEIDVPDSSGLSVPIENVEPNSLATYIPKENDTVLVQKKGLFGKTKWVEEKKK